MPSKDSGNNSDSGRGNADDLIQRPCSGNDMGQTCP